MAAGIAEKLPIQDSTWMDHMIGEKLNDIRHYSMKVSVLEVKLQE
jgi:hypothetical protein